MEKVGIIGWRGMVGSVLIERMLAENDFDKFEPLFFSTSQAGQAGPAIGREAPAVQDAHDLQKLMAMDILLSCQGGGYTEKIHPKLRQSGWQGYWIDAASTLRMNEDSIIVLDLRGQIDVNDPPVITSEWDIFIDDCDIQIVSDRKNVDIKYTLDGSIPHSASVRVKGPVRIAETTTISARIFRNGKPVSGTVQKTFTKVRPRPSLPAGDIKPGVIRSKSGRRSHSPS